MRIHFLQHVPFEGPAAIADWARARNHTLSGSRLDLGEPLPGLADLDWLVVMGGPMGVADVAAYPWMEPELRLIRQAVDSDRRVLGICLGAQLIAHALGARVYPASDKEIGWFPVEAIDGDTIGAFDGFPPRFTPLHWHGDTFDLPPGAMLLARGPSCPNQAFQLGRWALGLQFHLEATPESVETLVDHCAEEIGDGPWEMAPAEICKCAAHCAAVSPILQAVLNYLEDDDLSES
jgi:GMP synthase-like glutamine amidotransferase